jgi:hypothetical protein
MKQYLKRAFVSLNAKNYSTQYLITDSPITDY